MIRRALAATVTVGLLTSASPASAHSVDAYHGQDHAWLGSGHERLTVQDNECDSASAEAVYRTGVMVAADTPPHRFRDKNGCDPGTTTLNTGGSDGLAIYEFRICEVDYSAGTRNCGEWKNA